MNVTCPECRSVFRVDPAKVGLAGVRARCSICGGVITIVQGQAMDDDFGPPRRATPALPIAASRPSVPPAPPAPPPSMARPTSAVADAHATPAIRSPSPGSVAPGAPAQPPASVPPTAASTPAIAGRPIMFAPRPATPGTPPPGPVQRSSVTARPSATPVAPFGRMPLSPRPPQQAPPSTAAGPSSTLPKPAPGGPQPFGPSGAPGATRPVMPPPPAAARPVAASPVAPPRMSSTSTPPPGPPPSSLPSGAATAPAVGARGGTPARPPINPFLANDPNAKARRLARALVSDLVTYFPQRRDEGIRDGTLKTLFREEIKKSYEEYVEQVGKEFAESTTHFQDALNDILAGGQKLF